MAQKNTDQFKKEVYELVKDEYEVIGEYKKSSIPITFRHSICKTEFNMRPNGFLKGNRCPKCMRELSTKNKTKTSEQFEAEIEEKRGKEYTLLSPYTKAKDYIKVRHEVCGFEYEIKASNFLRGDKCPKCFGKMLKTTDEYKKEVELLTDGEYEVVGEYINSKTKIEIKHLKCGHVNKVLPSTFLAGSRCPKCAENLWTTNEAFVNKVNSLVGDEYTILSKFINSKTKVRLRHNKCGTEYDVKPGNFLYGFRCRKCSGYQKKDTNQFKREVAKIVGEEYSVIGEYSTAKTKILIKHNKCGHEYEVTPDNFLRGKRCPKCSESRGEKKISEFLNKYKIKYITEYTFEDCTYKSKLRFDFAVFDNDNNLLFLMEYDGEFHYQAVDSLGGETSFRETKIRDEIKTEYCKINKIPLIRIPYWEFGTIHKIIGKKLYRLGLII